MSVTDAKTKAKEILLEKSLSLIAEGDALQRAGDVDKALEAYTRAEKAVENIAKTGDEPVAAQLVKDVRSRVTALNELVARLPSQPTSNPSADAANRDRSHAKDDHGSTRLSTDHRQI